METLLKDEGTLRQESQEAVLDVRLHLVSHQQEYRVHGLNEPGVVRRICRLVYRKINAIITIPTPSYILLSQIQEPYPTTLCLFVRIS